MSQELDDALTDQHLLLFGRIVRAFARHETLMREIMAAVSGADVTSIRLLTARNDFVRLWEALLNLLRHRALPFSQIDQIRIWLEMPRNYSPLRDDIAHSLWVAGAPGNSIRPIWLTHGPIAAVRPVHDIASDSKPFIADDADQVAYTLTDLAEINRNLEQNHAGFRTYLISIDLLSSGPR
jgi:hypothetical protein